MRIQISIFLHATHMISIPFPRALVRCSPEWLKKISTLSPDVRYYPMIWYKKKIYRKCWNERHLWEILFLLLYFLFLLYLGTLDTPVVLLHATLLAHHIRHHHHITQGKGFDSKKIFTLFSSIYDSHFHIRLRKDGKNWDLLTREVM